MTVPNLAELSASDSSGVPPSPLDATAKFVQLITDTVTSSGTTWWANGPLGGRRHAVA